MTEQQFLDLVDRTLTAARAGVFHFRREGARWIDTRGAGELRHALSAWIGQQAGQAVALREN